MGNWSLLEERMKGVALTPYFWLSYSFLKAECVTERSKGSHYLKSLHREGKTKSRE